MKYWLMKTEPNIYGIEDLAVMPEQKDYWDGIRNYQVRNMIRDEMKMGDRAFIYHSNCKQLGITGIVEICKEAHPDPTAFDTDSKYFDPKSDPDQPRWFMVEVKLIRKLNRTITLQELKTKKELGDMRVIAGGNRLSITPVTASQWSQVLKME